MMTMQPVPLITKKEAEKILQAKAGAAEVSLDLGMTKSKVEIKGDKVCIQSQTVPLDDFLRVKENFCYIVEDNTLKKAELFSNETRLYYKLLPTTDWPTFTLSSTPMHRHTHLSPKEDTMLKIKEISPVMGRVLDTCCGLGYTATMASKKAELVETFEKDKYTMVFVRINPYSQELFSSRIRLHEEDVFTGIQAFHDAWFDRILHDPPTFKRAPELYTSEFYAQLFRVLKKGGILYHYTPMPQKTHGRQFFTAVVARLKKAGFQKVEYHLRSSGIRAVK